MKENVAAGEPEAELAAVPAPAVVQAPAKPVFGWVENTVVGDTEVTAKAKLDPGAKTSSINAEVIRTFERDGQEHVLFRVNFGELEETFESPLVRWVRIRSRSGEGETYRRPVVEMTLCLGGKKITEEVNLAERDHFNYPILIGRNMLSKENILVDSSKTFMHPPVCDK